LFTFYGGSPLRLTLFPVGRLRYVYRCYLAVAVCCGYHVCLLFVVIYVYVVPGLVYVLIYLFRYVVLFTIVVVDVCSFALLFVTFRICVCSPRYICWFVLFTCSRLLLFTVVTYGYVAVVLRWLGYVADTFVVVAALHVTLRSRVLVTFAGRLRWLPLFTTLRSVYVAVVCCYTFAVYVGFTFVC